MTRKHDAAIVAAYTGILMGRFDDYHKYIENLMGRPVQTHEIPALEHELKERSLDDWIELQGRLTEEEKEIIDCWAFRHEGKDSFLALAQRWMQEEATCENGLSFVRENIKTVMDNAKIPEGLQQKILEIEGLKM